MKKSRLPLMQILQKAYNIALIRETRGEMFADDLQEKQETNLYNRRQFLSQTMGAVTATGLILPSIKKVQVAPAQPKIAIVGAGIAGLNAAYQLQKRGLHATVYEASSENSWGRIRTKQIDSGGNRWSAELGGEFIDSGHKDILGLIAEFNLTKIDRITDAKGLAKESFFFGGKPRSEEQVIREFRNVAKIIANDAKSLPEDKSYRSKDPQVERLDHMSIEEYLRRLGMNGWLYDLLRVAYTSEFGLDIGQQSALNFITMIGTEAGHEFKVFGESDEKYKINGGNSRLIASLRKRLSGQIENNRQLVSITQKNKGYELSFAAGLPPRVYADVVILAIPFTTLREVDLDNLALTSRKMGAIQELGYGTSSKLLLNLSSRVWREHGSAGYLFNDKVYNGWDNSQGQNQNRGAGGYTVFLGGREGQNINGSVAENYVNELDKVFHKFKSSYSGNLIINWSADEDFVRGGYACYKTGQWTAFSGVEFEPNEPNGNVFFCGEHCSSDFQGYMNGGAETGRRVAERVAMKFSGKTKRITRRR